MKLHSDDVSQADFVLITALEEERDALLAKLPGHQRLEPSLESICIYYSAEVPVTFPRGSKGVYHVIVMPLLGMGRLQATIATTDAIHRWNPRYVILVGIAGGIAAKDVGLGDILVSEQIVDYEPQKLTREGPEIRWQVYRADPRLVGVARNLGDNWQELISTERPGRGTPKRHIGPVASGDKVIAFGEGLERYRDKWSMLIGIEMEAAGVAAAAFETAEPPGFFMVRGVSDLADEDKGSTRVEKWRSYACDVAASYAVALLKSGLVPSSANKRAQLRKRKASEPGKARRPDRAFVKPTESQPTPITLVIPSGSFWMGSLSDDPESEDNEKPCRELDLPEYRIGRYPVTNSEYAQFTRGSGHSPPGHWNQRAVPIGLEDHPVVNVSFEDAEAYCGWLSRVTGKRYRLPTEDEWEKAARGGLPETRCYPWGSEWRSGTCNTKELRRSNTSSVHEFEQVNQSPFNVVDMAGNVWEWTTSWYNRYPGSSHQSVKYGQIYRVVRGGSCRNSCREARVSCRGRYEPDVRRPYLGFRIVLEEVLTEVDRARIRQNLVAFFSRDELRTLCFDLGIEYENLPDTKGGLAREMVAHCERVGCMPKLLEACRQRRPKIPW